MQNTCFGDWIKMFMSVHRIFKPKDKLPNPELPNPELPLVLVQRVDDKSVNSDHVQRTTP